MKKIMGSGVHAVLLAEALGLNPAKIKGFTLRCYVGEVVTVETIEHVFDNDLKKLKEVIKKYRLIPEEKEPTPREASDAALHAAIEANKELLMLGKGRMP